MESVPVDAGSPDAHGVLGPAPIHPPGTSGTGDAIAPGALCRPTGAPRPSGEVPRRQWARRRAAGVRGCRAGLAPAPRPTSVTTTCGGAGFRGHAEGRRMTGSRHGRRDAHSVRARRAVQQACAVAVDSAAHAGHVAAVAFGRRAAASCSRDNGTGNTWHRVAYTAAAEDRTEVRPATGPRARVVAVAGVPLGSGDVPPQRSHVLQQQVARITRHATGRVCFTWKLSAPGFLFAGNLVALCFDFLGQQILKRLY